MIIEKNDKVYIITEFNNKWTIVFKNGKLSVAFDVSKELCPTTDDIRKYVLTNNEIF